MMYSSAIFSENETNLYNGSLKKIEKICDLAKIGAGSSSKFNSSMAKRNFSGIFNLVEISCSEIPFSARNFARSESKVLSRKDHA